MSIRNKANTKKKQIGSAVVETAIALVFFVPLFIAVPLLGKYADIKHRTLEASRYAAWERTVWAGDDSTWQGNEHSKSDAIIQSEISQRIMGHPLQAIHDGGASENPMWIDHARRNLTAGVANADGDNEIATLQLFEEQEDAGSVLVNRFARDGLGDIGGALNNISDAIGIIPGCDGVGLDFDRGLGMGDNNFARANVTVPVTMEHFTGTTDPVDMQAGSAILSNVWSASTEAQFHGSVDNLVTDELVECSTILGQGIAFVTSLPGSDGVIFGEGKKAGPVDAQANSSVMLDNYERR